MIHRNVKYFNNYFSQELKKNVLVSCSINSSLDTAVAATFQNVRQNTRKNFLLLPQKLLKKNLKIISSLKAEYKIGKYFGVEKCFILYIYKYFSQKAFRFFGFYLFYNELLMIIFNYIMRCRSFNAINYVYKSNKFDVIYIYIYIY